MFESDSITLNFQEKDNLLISSWKNCINAEQFIDGIKSCREFCDKIDLKNSLWHFNDFSFIVPPDLQKWTDTFLNVPVVEKAKKFEHVVFVVGSDVLALLSTVELVENGTAGVHPRYFGNEEQALKFLSANKKEVPVQTLMLPNLSFKVDKDYPNKTQILIDVNSEEIHQYIFLLNRMLKSRDFGIKNVSKFMTLTKREKEILKMLLNGYANEQISKALYVSYETVKTHRKNIFRKLECKNFRELSSYRILLSSPDSFL